MLIPLLLLIAATVALFFYCVAVENWPWALVALTLQGLLMIAVWLLLRRVPATGQQQMDITTIIGMIAAITLVALLVEAPPEQWKDAAWICLVGAPICALLIGHPLQEVIHVVSILRLSVLPPEVVCERMSATLARQQGAALSNDSSTAELDQLAATRSELEQASCLASRIRNYVLSAAIVSFLLTLSGGLLAAAATDWHHAVAQSLLPLAVGIALALLILTPLQARLDTYRCYLDCERPEVDTGDD